MSVADELGKLKRLLDEGLLTRSEFDGEKARLLASGSSDGLGSARNGAGFGITALILGGFAFVAGLAAQRPEAVHTEAVPKEDQALFSIFVAVLGIIFGSLGCSSRRKGRGMAVGGLICALLGLALGVATWQ